jgi:BD-FAE
MQDLKMDAYEPAESTEISHPAVVLVHGGAWHRGGRRLPPYEQFGGVHSMMEDYARMLAPLGYVCFALRIVSFPIILCRISPLMQKDCKTINSVLTDAGIERLTLVRGEMGLSLLTKDDSLILWNGILAGAEDVKKAVDHVRHSADKFGVDPNRIALGGHSAGAGNSSHVTPNCPK